MWARQRTWGILRELGKDPQAGVPLYTSYIHKLST